MTSATIEIERELNGVNYLIDVTVYAKLVSGAFSHEFGIHDPGPEIEYDSVDIETVYDQEYKVITSRKIIDQLEKMIDLDDSDFYDLEFDFSE